MELVRGGMKAPIATAWVSVADIGGGDGATTGQTIVTSSHMNLIFSDIPSMAFQPLVELTFTHRLVSSGGVRTWFRINGQNLHENLTITDNSVAFGHYTRRAGATDVTGIVRRIFVVPLTLMTTISNTGSDRFSINCRANGSADNTVWEVKDIAVRLIYVPL